VNKKLVNEGSITKFTKICHKNLELCSMYLQCRCRYSHLWSWQHNKGIITFLYRPEDDTSLWQQCGCYV